MPTYSYACTECDNRFDIVQSFTDDSLTQCNECSGKLRKLFNSVGIVFKGSGFYRTDSRSGSTASESASSSSSDSSSGSGSSSKSESTSSTKTESSTSSPKPAAVAS
ncbi:FmdB family transcriptional regulator [Aldersonia sp. NBC_00410]|uniref:FmdB family zinc ribbon protein n=1 Tax=Aldersonia sp. NBC_00410 TaxID=2975954 RepID=UPI0022537111|nr:FmdB family zinc ribbon protein [Aldersonia sp. NBC_00410]MCX5045565.1 FmdB family transcriptional regulator [Aldersonia sp. NBC_00410]